MDNFIEFRKNQKWGTPFDRGCADAYCNKKQPRPHKIVVYYGYIEQYESELTDSEIQEYMLGYEFEPERQNKKENKIKRKTNS